MSFQPPPERVECEVQMTECTLLFNCIVLLTVGYIQLMLMLLKATSDIFYLLAEFLWISSCDQAFIQALTVQ